jgi:hypothetical protein
MPEPNNPSRKRYSWREYKRPNGTIVHAMPMAFPPAWLEVMSSPNGEAPYAFALKTPDKKIIEYGPAPDVEQGKQLARNAWHNRRSQLASISEATGITCAMPSAGKSQPQQAQQLATNPEPIPTEQG